MRQNYFCEIVESSGEEEEEKLERLHVTHLGVE